MWIAFPPAKIDYLRGLKENVIMGRLIPAGTGMLHYRNVAVPGEPTPEPEMEEADVLAGIPGYAEEARVEYAGGLSEENGEGAVAE